MCLWINCERRSLNIWFNLLHYTYAFAYINQPHTIFYTSIYVYKINDHQCWHKRQKHTPRRQTLHAKTIKLCWCFECNADDVFIYAAFTSCVYGMGGGWRWVVIVWLIPCDDEYIWKSFTKLNIAFGCKLCI